MLPNVDHLSFLTSSPTGEISESKTVLQILITHSWMNEAFCLPGKSPSSLGFHSKYKELETLGVGIEG